jgi:hypothetical protein
MRVYMLILAASVLLVGTGRVGGQSMGHVYHLVGPAMFTNAAAVGFPDWQLAGSNFMCGVYAGTLSNALAPYSGLPGSHLQQAFAANGLALMSGSVVMNAPPETPVLLQFRAWPAGFGSYEEAVAWSNPSPPVGLSEIVLAIPGILILNLPIDVGPVWLSPLASPGAAHGPLACRLADNSLILSWPTNSASWLVVGASSLTSNAVWSAIERPVSVTNGHNEVTVPLTNAVQFFRLSL